MDIVKKIMSKTAYQEFGGIVLSIRKHKEQDALIKVFTLEYGQRMFFVRNYYKANHAMKTALLPFSHATYIGTIKSDGLCFLQDYKEVENFSVIQQDVYLNAYSTYFANLADAAIEDGEVNKELFDLLLVSYQQLQNGLDPEIIMNIFEMNMLRYFGVFPKLGRCAVCGNEQEPFDYSVRYSGVLCTKHFHEDPKRLQIHPAAIHFCRIFQVIQPTQVNQISLKSDTKEAIRQLIDFFYDEFVGIRLKSKAYIDQMYEWEQSMQVVKRKREEEE